MLDLIDRLIVGLLHSRATENVSNGAGSVDNFNETFTCGVGEPERDCAVLRVSTGYIVTVWVEELSIYFGSLTCYWHSYLDSRSGHSYLGSCCSHSNLGSCCSHSYLGSCCCHSYLGNSRNYLVNCKTVVWRLHFYLN